MECLTETNIDELLDFIKEKKLSKDFSEWKISKKNKIEKIKISVICKHGKSYFYYPDSSCKTDDGGMQMLIKTLDKIEEPYKLNVETQLKEVQK